MTMKKQIIYMVCATALLSSCHIYKAYERPDSIDATGVYRDPVSETETCLGRRFSVIRSYRR